jgi:hypothetical protein
MEICSLGKFPSRGGWSQVTPLQHLVTMPTTVYRDYNPRKQAIGVYSERKFVLKMEKSRDEPK